MQERRVGVQTQFEAASSPARGRRFPERLIARVVELTGLTYRAEVLDLTLGSDHLASEPARVSRLASARVTAAEERSRCCRRRIRRCTGFRFR